MAGHDRPGRSASGIVAPVERMVRPWVDRILSLPLAILGLDLMGRYGAAGGGVTAAGLAYSVLVAILPTLLLLVSLLGFIIADPAERERVLEFLASQIPPLEGLISEMLKQISEGAWAFSIIGLIGLVWGASRVYAALDTSVALFFPREPRRDMVRQTLESLACVAFFIGSVLGATALILFVADLSILPSDSADKLIRRLIAVLIMTAWFAGTLTLAYWYVPARRVPWRDAIVPGLLAGVLVSAITQIFAVIAPVFFRSLRIYGTFVALFAALVWLSLCTQVVLIGVAWLARRVKTPPPVRPGTERASRPVAEDAAGT